MSRHHYDAGAGLSSDEAPELRRARRLVLAKVSRLALLYAAEGGGDLSLLRFYRDAIVDGRVLPPGSDEPAEERWVLWLGYRRLDEAWLDAELIRFSPREPRHA